MPLPTNYSRPSLPYAPLQSLPNDRRFVNLTTLQQPPTAEMFDAELNAVIDKINLLAAAINEVVAGNIPGSDDPQNAGKMLVTDGAGNLSFILVGSENIALASIATALLQNQAVTQAKIGDGAVGTAQLSLGSVTFNILVDGAVGNAKVANNSLYIVKLRSSGHSCFLIGDDANYTYTELPITGNQNWFIPTRIPNDTKPSLQSLLSIWGAQADNILAGSKIADQTLNLSKLVTGATGGFVFSVAGQASVQILPVLDTDRWKLATRGDYPTATLSMQTLDTIWSKTANTFDGSKITSGSLAISQIANLQKNLPFASGFINSDGSVSRINNATAARNGQGVYTITFTSVASGKYYPVSITTDDNGGNLVLEPNVSNRSTTSFVVNMYATNGSRYDSPFSFIVFDL